MFKKEQKKTVKEEVIDLEDLVLHPTSQENNCDDVDIRKELPNGAEDAKTFEKKSHTQKDFFCELCHLQFDKKAVFDIHFSIVHKIDTIIKSELKENKIPRLSDPLVIIEKNQCSNLGNHNSSVQEKKKSFKCSI